MDYNNDFRYDLKVGQVKEKELAEILNDKTIEVKFDKRALDTGNVYWTQAMCMSNMKVVVLIVV
jgi:hypothetical protein